MVDKLSTDGLKAAADTTKQVISLSTGVIALSITFLDKLEIKGATGGPFVPWTMFVAWILFGLAVFFGILTLDAITGSLDALDRKQNGQTVSEDQRNVIDLLSMSRNIRGPALKMNITFLVALCFIISTGFWMLMFK